jgi:hypothetical protein
MTSRSDTEEVDLDVEIKSEGKDSPRSTDHSNKPSTKSATKRRTKTGCLTCRKRRIKCGEEKPFCKNCVKSKRECAGYVQPLVYKQQQGLSNQDCESRASQSDGEFHFNGDLVGIGPSPQPQYGPFNPFLSLQSQFGNTTRFHNNDGRPPVFQYPPPDSSQPYALPLANQSFDSHRRHSFQHHNAQLFGYGQSLPAHTAHVDPAWARKAQITMMPEQVAYQQDVYAQQNAMLQSPGAYSEGYPGVPSSYLSFDTVPLHG